MKDFATTEPVAPATTPKPRGPQPRTPAPPTQAAEVLPHAPTPLFFFKHHPARWMCVGGRWLPQLASARLDPGVNAVDKAGDYTLAMAEDSKQGWTWLPWDVDGAPYIRAWDCVGGTYHCSRWETPRWVGNRPVPSEVDTNGYHAFLARLVDSGKIAPPSAAVIEAKRDEQGQRVERIEHEPPSPASARALSEARARHAELEAAQ